MSPSKLYGMAVLVKNIPLLTPPLTLINTPKVMVNIIFGFIDKIRSFITEQSPLSFKYLLNITILLN